MATSAIAREINRIRVLQTLLENALMSRAEAARDLRLSKSTLSSVVGRLIATTPTSSTNWRSRRAAWDGRASSSSRRPAPISSVRRSLLTPSRSRAPPHGQTGRPRHPEIDWRGVMEATFGQLKQMIAELYQQLSAKSQIKGVGMALLDFVIPMASRSMHSIWAGAISGRGTSCGRCSGSQPLSTTVRTFGRSASGTWTSRCATAR